MPKAISIKKSPFQLSGVAARHSLTQDIRQTGWDRAVTNIFVGNLDFNASEEQLGNLFATYGPVETVTIVKDRDTSEAHGFAFIEMTRAADAQAAIASLDGVLLNDRALRVNEARAKLDRDWTRDSGSRDHRRHRM